MSGSADRKVIRLHGRGLHRPDIEGLARHQLRSSRERLGLTIDEFTEVLAPMLGWELTSDALSAWETTATPPGDVLVAASLVSHDAPPAETSSGFLGKFLSERFADVSAVYPTRSEFQHAVAVEDLLDGASEVRMAGLSLNLLCQQYAEQRLRKLIEGGTTVNALFLDPDGTSIKGREAEEGYPPGQLSALGTMNINILVQRVYDQLSPEARPRLQIATYDQTIRFNLIFIDGVTCVAQPYLAGTRGIDSPTFLLHRRWESAGLFPVFERMYTALLERSQPV